MIKAEDAAQITRDANKSQLVAIDLCIRNAAEQGKEKVLWYKRLSEEEFQILHQAGYGITAASNDRSIWLIEW